jgi:hypothetical protein
MNYIYYIQYKLWCQCFFGHKRKYVQILFIQYSYIFKENIVNHAQKPPEDGIPGRFSFDNQISIRSRNRYRSRCRSQSRYRSSKRLRE